MIRETEFFTTTELAQKLKMNVQVLTNSNRTARAKKLATVTAQAEQIIAGRAGRKDLLDYILAQFEPQRTYSEAEVDRIINRFHADSRQIRVQFVDEQMMERINGQYRRRPDYKLIG